MNEQKFDGMGKIYSQFRPNYPAEFINYLFSSVGITKNSVIADIGAGTGILTKQLLEQGNKVFAVEPNNSMRQIAEHSLNQYKSFVSVNGTAESTTLKNNSVDFITAAQAFHWFNKSDFKAECKRILKQNGKVILVWNCRDNEIELIIENDKINRKYCPNYKGFSGGMHGIGEESSFSDFFEGEYEFKVFENHLHFNEQSFIGRNLSSSYALKENDANYKEYVAELKALFKQYSVNGTLIMKNLTKSYVGKV